MELLEELKLKVGDALVIIVLCIVAAFLRAFSVLLFRLLIERGENVFFDFLVELFERFVLLRTILKFVDAPLAQLHYQVLADALLVDVEVPDCFGQPGHDLVILKAYDVFEFREILFLLVYVLVRSWRLVLVLMGHILKRILHLV